MDVGTGGHSDATVNPDHLSLEIEQGTSGITADQRVVRANQSVVAQNDAAQTYGRRSTALLPARMTDRHAPVAISQYRRFARRHERPLAFGRDLDQSRIHAVTDPQRLARNALAVMHDDRDIQVRTPGHVTGSKDGKPVAPLLGDIKDYDGGTTDFQVGPLNYALAYCDHIVMYCFTPVSQLESECKVSWLVNGDAEEGKDYDRDNLTWLWDVTTIADQHIIERNQEGVNSHFYTPGPFSEMETRSIRLLDWYLGTLERALKQ